MNYKKLWLNDRFYLINPQGDGIYSKDNGLVFTWEQLDAILVWTDFAKGLRERNGIE